jgi:Mg/Co/Ni transporter MgtE
MGPDFVAVPKDSLVADALAAVRAANTPEQVSADVFLLNPDETLAGAVPLVNLVRGNDGGHVSELAQRGNTSVHEDDDFSEVARIMADFNLTVLPVVNDEDHVVGVITVDDVLEAMLPDSWRRRAEADAATG